VWRHGGQALVLLLILLAFVIGYGLRGGDHDSPPPTESTSESASAQWYTCSMHPEVRMPNPDDKCPICFMDLIPVSAAGEGSNASLGPRQIELSPAAQALIDVQTVPVARRFIEHDVSMVGQVEVDETRLAYITAYVAGRLDRMFVDTTGITVREGDHLAEIYSPDLLVARQELIEARRALDRLGPSAGDRARENADAVRESARERLRLLGLTDAQITAIENEAAADGGGGGGSEGGASGGGGGGDHVTLYAPVGGVVIEKHAKPGSYVNEGDRIYTIADLARVWVVLEAYESDLPWLRYGQTVHFTTEAFGEQMFEGRVALIDPLLNPRTRTVRVRVNVDNAEGRLRPGMFVRAHVAATVAEAGRVIAPELEGMWISPMHPEVVRDEPGDCPVCGMDLVRAEELGYSVVNAEDADPPLIVPDTAVLRTGQRAVVYVRTDDETFEGREIELGPRGDGFFVVRSGLTEGEQVVTRGNFQIDSALQIQAKPSMMNPPGNAPGSDPGDRPTSAATEPASQPAPRVHLHGDAASPVRNLVDAYLRLSQALAEDEAGDAATAADGLAEALREVEDAELPAAVDEVWARQVEPLQEGMGQLVDADDLEAVRVGFEPVSIAMLALARAVHIEGVGPLYRAHCPMAFDFRGASWLTRERAILNPYFGESMLRCGTIEETLSIDEPGGHDHE
jgi:Cu(I)/Ag(I) efflux system membrane fusion protein